MEPFSNNGTIALLELLQAVYCKIRELASSSTNEEDRQLIWELADSAHNLPAAWICPEKFFNDDILAEIAQLESLLARLR